MSAEFPLKRPTGRPAKPLDERTVVTSVRLTPERKAKLRRLGVAWLVTQLDKVPD